jgi:hypothetical protein
MRRKKPETLSQYKILVLDDETGIIDSLYVFLGEAGTTLRA